MVPRDGVWNMRNMKFIEAKAMNSFEVINVTRCGDREIGLFMSSLTLAVTWVSKPLVERDIF